MTGKMKYALYGVKLHAQNFILSHINDTLLKTMLDITTASVHRHHELGRSAAAAVAFLPICVINDAGDKWRKRLCVGIHVKE